VQLPLELPEDAGISYGGVQQLSPGVYAIVESAKFLKNKCLADMSDLFLPIRKDHGKLVNGSAVRYKYYLADVEGFISPTVVIPDLGGQTNDYFVLKAREDWKEVFTKWLLDGDKGDISDEEDDDDEDTEDMQDVLGNTSGSQFLYVHARFLCLRALSKNTGIIYLAHPQVVNFLH
jgi:hypothetical protein